MDTECFDVFHGSHGSSKLYRFHGFCGIPNNLNYICRYPNDIWRDPNDTSDIRIISDDLRTKSGDTPTIFKYIRRHSDATDKIHSWINSYNKPSVSAVQEPCRNRECRLYFGQCDNMLLSRQDLLHPERSVELSTLVR